MATGFYEDQQEGSSDFEDLDIMNAAQEDTSLLSRNPRQDEQISGKAWGRVGAAVTGKTQYPRGVFFILGNEFCERFSYYGMRAILVIYLTDWLHFNKNTATAIYHTFIVLCYFSPIGGAMLADGWIGKYKTILYLSILYGLGNLVMSFTAFPPPEWVGPVIGLLMIGIGTGGIKPCVSAFGGDQFKDEQEKEQNQFFSVFYFAINMGSIFSMLLTPQIRANVTCFNHSCFPLAFGIPAALMVISLVVFVIGQRFYILHPPTGNVIGQSAMCIGRALKNKCKSGTGPKAHWLDYADDKFDVEFIEKVQGVLRVFLLFLPLPIFWALFDQQGSRWTLQARQLNLNVVGEWNLPPDQIQALNPILIILLIPLFESVVYPLCAKCNLLKRPLQRMCLGMLLASASFVIAAFLQIKIDITLDNGIPKGHIPLRFVNAISCPVNINSPWTNDTLGALESTQDIPGLPGTYTASFSTDSTACPQVKPAGDVTTLSVELKDKHAYFITVLHRNTYLLAKQFSYPSKKPEQGGASVSILYAASQPADQAVVLQHDTLSDVAYQFNITEYDQTPFQEIITGTYSIILSHHEASRHHLTARSGSVHTVLLFASVDDPDMIKMVDIIDVQSNMISIWCQIPQYLLITTGEILFSISGLSFAYSQAPPSMKSVVQAGWLLTVALGNLVDVIVAGGQWLPSQSAEFFFFAALMALTSIIFSIMAHCYTYVQYVQDSDLAMTESSAEEDNKGMDMKAAEGGDDTVYTTTLAAETKPPPASSNK